jgi:hypothetical protein
MKLLAVACSKELINKYRTLAKSAKLNPIGLVPDVVGIQRILSRYNQLYSVPLDKDYAILDMGDQSFKIHFYNHGVYDVTRSLEPGGYSFAQTISEITGTDVHIARISEEENVNDIQTHEKLIQLYESRAVEIMRALNFYSYSNTSNTIDTLYYFGGSGNIRKLVQILSETLNIPVKPLDELSGVSDEDMRVCFFLSPQSYGVTLDPDDEVKALTEAEIEALKTSHGTLETENGSGGDTDASQIISESDGKNASEKTAEDVVPDSFLNNDTELHRLKDYDEELVRLDDGETSDTKAEADYGTSGFSDGDSSRDNSEEVKESTLKAIEELTEQINKGNS